MSLEGPYPDLDGKLVSFSTNVFDLTHTIHSSHVPKRSLDIWYNLNTDGHDGNKLPRWTVSGCANLPRMLSYLKVLWYPTIQ